MVNYDCFDIKEAATYINKSPKTIYKMMKKLGISLSENWTEEEINILKEKGAYEASLLINKSLNACRIKQSRLHRN